MHAECDYNNDDNKLNNSNSNNNNLRAMWNENPHSSSTQLPQPPPFPLTLLYATPLPTVAPQFGCVALVIIYSSIAMECLVVHHAAHGFSCHSTLPPSMGTVPLSLPKPCYSPLLFLPPALLSGNWRTTANKFSKASRLLGLRFDTVRREGQPGGANKSCC